MKKIILILTCIVLYSCTTTKKIANDYDLLFEKSGGTETDTYENVIQYYKNLSEDYNQISLLEIGTTDSGHPALSSI